MNEDIRAAVQARLNEKHMSRADLARAVGAHQNAITRALNDTGGRGGSIPPLWAAILEALDLRLTVEPGQGSKTGEEGQA